MNKSILFCLLLFWAPATAYAKLKIAWFSNLYPEEVVNRGSSVEQWDTTGFWATTHIFVDAAAEDLGVDLKVYFGEHNAAFMAELAEQVLSNEQTRPDGIIFHNWLGMGERILQIAEQYGVKSLVFNAGFAAEHVAGKPREKYRHWVGQIFPDDEHAGYLLAQTLITAARQLPSHSDKIRMIALEGNRTSQASALRVKGLQRALKEHQDVVVEQYFHSKWKRELGKNAFLLGIQRYPHLSAFWAASESIAIGVVEGAHDRGWMPNRDFVTGGVDLLPHNYRYLISNDLHTSIGGHYVDGAWALIMLHDFLSGFDFAAKQSATLKTRMIALTTEEVAGFGDLREKLLPKNVASVDFRNYSKVYNRAIDQYRFPTKQLLQQIQVEQ